MRLRRIAVVVAAVLLLASASVAGAADAALTVGDVDTAAYPQVKLQVSLPPSLAGSRDVAFQVSENGRQIDGVKAVSTAKEAQPAQVVLVMDGSGSMKGEPLANAQLAARGFVESLDPQASVAIVTFSDKPRVMSGFTGDRAALSAAISGTSAAGETALYDALVEAAALVPQTSAARPSIIVLSDGGDTVSGASFDRTIGRLKAAGAPVYAVALKSDEYNPHALELIAGQTGGRLVPVTKAEALAAEFKTIAEEINSAWTVSYESARPQTKDIELDVTATDGTSKAAAQLAYQNPAVQIASSPLVVPDATDQPAMLVAAVGLGFISVVMLVGGVLLLTLRDRTGLEQMRYYDQLQAENEAPEGATDHVRTAIVGAVGSVAGRRGLTQLVGQRLEAAGWPLRPAEYMTAHIALVIAAGVITELATGRMSASLVVVVIATIAPMMAIDIAATRRHQRFESQLPDVLGMIAGSLRGGWGIQQAIALACQEAPEPSASELKRVDTETRLGMPLERSMMSMADRMGSNDFRAAVNAIAIQRDVGGNLAEILDIVARTIRERDAMRRQVSALTAEGRLSAWILIGLPFAVLALMIIFNPEYVAPMFQTSIGLLTLAFGSLLLLVGSVWLFRLTKIEV